MLDLKYVKNNLDLVKNGMEKRKAKIDFASLLDKDDKRKTLLLEIEDLRHKRNVVSGDIAKMKKSGEDAGSLIGQMKGVSETIKKLDTELSTIEEAVHDFLITLPNIPHEDVPISLDDTENRLEKTYGEPKKFDFKPKPHWEIGEDLGILDFTRAAKLTGARFPLYLGKGAGLERALINFMLDIHTSEHGYTETLPPFIVNRATMTGTGQLPKFEEDLFKLEGWDYYLIPTSEVPMTNIYAGEIIDESILPC
ncbi:MAG: serine--tRNA ligase, partial [Deltaproteobacteria bacterium]